MSVKPYRNDLIKGAMAAGDITVAKLAALTGLSPDTLTRIRSGDGTVTLKNLIAVADALNLSMQELFEPKPEPAAA